MMITSCKCRPRNSAGRFWLTELPYQTRPPGLHQSPLDDATFRAIEEIFHDRGVIVFPDQRLTEEEHIAFSRRFGELETFLIHVATVAARALPVAVSGELAATRAALVTEFRCTRTELLAAANAQGGAAQEKVDRALSILDRRTGDALARVDAAITVTNTAVGAANAQLTSANGTLAGIREDLKPPLQETQITVQDLRDSWDDLYWDVKASVESATVAARGVAKASEAAGKAAPKLADAAVKNGDNIAGITADVHTATSAFVKPKSTWQKIKSALWLVAYGAAHAI